MSGQEFEGAEVRKPEWFALIESDTQVQHTSRNKRFRVMALTGPLLLLSAGLLFAQTNESENASAIDNSVISSVAPGTSELAGSTQVTANSSSTTSTATSPVGDASQSTTNISTSKSSSANSQRSTFETSKASRGSTSSSGSVTTSQGFVPPAPAVGTSVSSEDDDESYGSGDLHGDDDGYEHEDFDEGDDD